MLHIEALPEEGDEIAQCSLGVRYRRSLRISLNLGDHRDRSLIGLLFREVIAEERAVSFSFPADVEIEGDPCFRLSPVD